MWGNAKANSALVFALLVSLAVVTASASEKAAAKPAPAPVDFLAGDWRILDPDGKEIGHSTIVVQAEGSMLFEVRTVGQREPQPLWLMNSERHGGWTQLFIGPTGSIREFPPQSRPGEWPLVMGAPVTLQNGDKVVFRMTILRAYDEKTRRVLEMSRDQGGTWITVFDYTYVRKQQ